MITSCLHICAQLKDSANLICFVFSKKIYQRSLMFKSDMADQFQGGICGGNLWNGSMDFFGSSTCSISSWPYNQESFLTDIKASSSSRSSDDSTASDGNILQDAENTQQPMSSYHEWHQDFIFDNEQSEGNYSYVVPQDSTCAVDSSMMNYCEQISLVNCPQTVHKSCQSTSTTDPNFLANSNPYSHTSSLPRISLFVADSLQQQKQQSLLENNPEMSYSSGILRTRDESHIAKPSYSKPSSKQPQFLPPSHRNKTRAHLHSLSAKNEEPRDFGSAVKKAGNESAGTKRARVETPSPLPTFKVRKEKLGDRVTALQQLVSPFGKTDTASVLHEAIEYIKFLHDQVSALSAPYLKNDSPRLQHHRQANDQVDDLKSRGLCLVPISSTFPIAAETTADLWTPTLFGQSFR